MRALKGRSHYIDAECATCGRLDFLSDGTTTRDIGRRHAARTGHHVRVTVEYTLHYNYTHRAALRGEPEAGQ